MRLVAKPNGLKGRFPDFLVIGSAKSGTTTLYEYLQRHPSVFLPALKEPEFFSKDSVFEKGEAWYKALFAEAGGDQICGEASTTYTRWPNTPDVPARIRDLLPNPKFIYLMRNPVERAYSHYCHHMRLEVTMTFEEALNRNSIYVDCSLYASQIDQYLRFFPKEAFLFLLLDDLVIDPHGVMTKVERFLKIDAADVVSGSKCHANERHHEFVSFHTTGRIRRLPGGSIIADVIPSKLKRRIHDFVRQSSFGGNLSKKHAISPMLRETRKALVERFREPNEMLSSRIRRDLSFWNK
ncbi:MAG TPA: sulfotransferase [Terriglobia bacterium]|nr:sulfotransferase [Terriglobia bacterium]